jgi:site-specific DNA recombinase
MQRQKIEGYCSLHDLDLAEVICDDGYSAKSLNRPGVQRLLALVDAGEAEAVIIYKLDRLSRRTRDVLDLVDRFAKVGVGFHSIQETLGHQVSDWPLCATDPGELGGDGAGSDFG